MNKLKTIGLGAIAATVLVFGACSAADSATPNESNAVIMANFGDDIDEVQTLIALAEYGQLNDIGCAKIEKLVNDGNQLISAGLFEFDMTDYEESVLPGTGCHNGEQTR